MQEGLRRELVRLVANAMHKDLTFPDYTRLVVVRRMEDLASTLDGLKRSIEYLQVWTGSVRGGVGLGWAGWIGLLHEGAGQGGAGWGGWVGLVRDGPM